MVSDGTSGDCVVTMPRKKKNPSSRQVLEQIKQLERHINKLEIIPATEVYRSKVILPLFSKALIGASRLAVQSAIMLKSIGRYK
jgi:hypothetical protein